MPFLVTADEVQELLSANYGVNPDGSSPDLMVYVEMADSTIQDMISCALAKQPKPFVHRAQALPLIEKALAAHYYTKMDPTYSSKSTGGASGSFVRSNTTEQEPYKDLAINLDNSGCLKAILNRQVASAVWLGKTPSQQIPLDQRD